MTAQATSAVAEATSDATTSNLGGKYLTFKLAGEEHGLEILKVREIVKIMDITTVPKMPGFIKGVVNLRGKVIPVIDLRIRFDLPEAEYNEETCIIVVNVGTETGVVVDTVQEVLDIASEAIEPAPAFGSQVDTEFILGMGKVGDDVKILLDIDRVMTGEERDELASFADQ